MITQTLVLIPAFSGLMDSLVSGKWAPSGVPAIYKLLEQGYQPDSPFKVKVAVFARNAEENLNLGRASSDSLVWAFSPSLQRRRHLLHQWPGFPSGGFIPDCAKEGCSSHDGNFPISSLRHKWARPCSTFVSMGLSQPISSCSLYTRREWGRANFTIIVRRLCTAFHTSERREYQ